MTLAIIIPFSFLLFVFVALFNKQAETIIAFTKGWMFGFVYDKQLFEDEMINVHTFQCAIGFVLLNCNWESDAK
jgi:hypothetical protein